ncbi:Hybrid signal transduction histidine kinase K [Sphaceloma murrayae]|uniref:Hybrid signal transduction histidine kinase K n=1 Tax=Sphaceloma murrayae TaxID=2082308 RepID=A0A2K1R126_9PEZI|nr:Hybrid signal transduction histidine kinase K [Sphaceloma murrayae]
MKGDRPRPSFTIDTRTYDKPLDGFDPLGLPFFAKDTPMGDTLHTVGLLEFFDCEPSPTLIFDLDRQSPIYENRAFQEWKKRGSREGFAVSGPPFLEWLSEWSKNTSSGDFAMAGRTWRTSMLRKRWMVLTSYERQLDTTVHSQTVPPTPPASAALPTPPSTVADVPPMVRRTSGRYSPSPSFSSTSSGADAVLSVKKPLDWTKYHVPGISAHVQTIKNFPWHETTLGGIDTWSETLRATVQGICANEEPRILLWGPDHVLVPNEACAPVLGAKFPLSIGGRGEDIWSEAWPALSGFISRTESEAKATRIPGMPLPMRRHGYDEETFWMINFLPVMGSKGHVAGVVDEFTEITQSVIDDRRRDIIIKTSETLSRISTLEELWDGFLRGIERATDDVPYAVVYTPTGSTHVNPTGVNTPSEALHHFSLRGSVGLDHTNANFPHTFDLNSSAADTSRLAHACSQAWKTGELVVMREQDGSLPPAFAVGVPGRANGGVVNTACIIPVPDLIGNNQLAFVLLSLTPRRPFDQKATMLVQSFSDVLTRAASTIFLPDEKRRAQQRFQEIETTLSQQLRTTSLEAEQTEARYEKILKSARVGMYIIRSDEKLMYYNDAYLACTGATKEQAESSHVPGSLVHEDDSERVYSLWHHCIAEKQTIVLEYRMKKPWKSVDSVSGKEISGDTWILSSASPELDDQGNVVQVMGWMLDISDRKYHEQQHIKRLEEEQAEVRFSRLAQTAPMGMYLIKPDGTPIYLNDAYYETLGFTKAEFEDAMERGVGWADAILPEDQHIVNDAWRALSEEGKPIAIEYRVKKPWRQYDSATGTEMVGPTWLQGTAFAEKDDSGTVVAVQGFVTDISLKKFSERLLTERLEEALETKRSADRFIDMVSHEMRNPLSAILQSADGILTALNPENTSRSLSVSHHTGRLSADAVEIAMDAGQTIMLCAQHQKRIVDDILTLSKLDSNLLVISPDKVNLPALIDKCFKMYESELERADIEASLIVESGYNDLAVNCVMLDSSRVLQVVINLLTNAIKFTQHSSHRKIRIYLDASKTRPEKSNHKAPWVKARANRPDHTSSSEWGTGETIFLQLAVSDTGKGLTEQELKLMFNRFSQASPKTYKQYGGSGLGLFISRELTELQGGQIGVHSEAGMGSTFTFYVKARRAMDDGTTPMLSTIPSTASSRSGSRDRTIIAEPKGSLPTQQTLSRRISVNLRRPPPVAKIVTNPARPSLHVLVVEDNEINQRVMANQLRRLGCTVYLAGNGVEALHFLETTNLWHSNVYSTEPVAASSPPVPLSCILMDLEMPILGGLGCVKRIREMQSHGELTRHIPTIAVTANARSEQISVAIKSGMDSVVTKPFKVPDLVPLMEELVRKLDPDKRR